MEASHNQDLPRLTVSATVARRRTRIRSAHSSLCVAEDGAGGREVRARVFPSLPAERTVKWPLRAADTDLSISQSFLSMIPRHCTSLLKHRKRAGKPQASIRCNDDNRSCP